MGAGQSVPIVMPIKIKLLTVVFVLVLLLIMQQEELIGWHPSGVTRTGV